MDLSVDEGVSFGILVSKATKATLHTMFTLVWQRIKNCFSRCRKTSKKAKMVFGTNVEVLEAIESNVLKTKQ